MAKTVAMVGRKLLMAVNLDKPHLWKSDTQASVDYFNKWFMKFAPKAFRETRTKVSKQVKKAVSDTNYLRGLSVKILRSNPGILPTLRMACCPPLAVDRLVGLAGTNKNLVKNMEKGSLAIRMQPKELNEQLNRMLKVIRVMLDKDIFPWLKGTKQPGVVELARASTIVADRLTGAVANPIIRNAQEKRQFAKIAKYLKDRGYTKRKPLSSLPLQAMEPGTFTFHHNVETGTDKHRVNVSIDVVIQPFAPRADKIPVLVEAKSAGDFTNTNKRRKEEAKKINQLKAVLAEDVCYVVFLCGYFDAGCLGYEAQDGIDWVWEHRIEDMELLGV